MSLCRFEHTVHNSENLDRLLRVNVKMAFCRLEEKSVKGHLLDLQHLQQLQTLHACKHCSPSADG